MKSASSLSVLVFVVILGAGLGVAYALRGEAPGWPSYAAGALAFVLAAVVSSAVQVANQWDKSVVLRVGRFQALRGQRYSAGRCGRGPVLAGRGPQEGGPGRADYQAAIGWECQTALRDVTGKTMLADMLEGRDVISAQLQKIIDVRTEPWGITVISVEVKDVLIPPSLESAMSMQAQAERERQARVILGDSERQVAEKFGEGSKTYANNPIAFHLRAMNMLYEGLKQNSTIVIVPSTAVETMQLGGLAGLTALTMGIGQEGVKNEAASMGPDAAPRIVSLPDLDAVLPTANGLASANGPAPANGVSPAPTAQL